MATITATSMTGSGSRAITVTTATASDTFNYRAGVKQTLVIYNDTGSPITPNIDGDGGTTVPVSGVGSVDVSGGYDVPSIADGATAAIPTDTISAYLSGTIAVTGADGAELHLLEY